MGMETNGLGSVYLPSTDDPSGFVELARTQKGKLYRKQILHMSSEFVHPNAPTKKIKVDEALAKKLVENFNTGGDIVQVPIVGGDNQHTEDPTKNLGEVTQLEYDETGVYAFIDDRRSPERVASEGELGSTLIGASALMHLNYPDTKDGHARGPTLLHVAVTNRPYIGDLADFEEIVAASAESWGVDKPEVWSPAKKTEDKMDLDELLATLKDVHGIDTVSMQSDLTAAQETIAELEAKGNEPGEDEGADTKELVAAFSNVLKQAGANLKDTGELDLSDVANAVIELSGEKIELTAKVAALEELAKVNATEKATAEVDKLVSEGRILPKQREAMISLSQSDRATFDALVPDTSIVSLSAIGVTTHDEPVREEFAKEADRLAELANSSRTNKK